MRYISKHILHFYIDIYIYVWLNQSIVKIGLNMVCSLNSLTIDTLVLVHPFTILFVRHCNWMMAQIMDKDICAKPKNRSRNGPSSWCPFFIWAYANNHKEKTHWNEQFWNLYTVKYECVSFEQWIKYRRYDTELPFTQNIHTHKWRTDL